MPTRNRLNRRRWADKTKISSMRKLQIERYKKYFYQDKPQATKIWAFPEWNERKFPNKCTDFTDDNFSISIIDQFAGQIPFLLTKETLLKQVTVKFVPMVLLDSNVLSNLHLFITQPARLNSSQRIVIRGLLKFFALTYYDYNPAFYYMEAFGKNTEETFGKYAAEFSTTILQVQMMDKDHFINNNEVKPARDLFDEYAHRYGTKDLVTMGTRHMESQKLVLDKDKGEVDISYIILLKAAYIHKTSNKGIVSKFLAISEFIQECFGIVSWRDLAIALYYFSGKLDKFLPLQRGANFEAMQRSFYSTAWDVFLLRLPEMFLAAGDAEETMLAYICTGERSLQYIGKKFGIREIYCYNEIPYLTQLLFDFEELAATLDSETNRILIQEFENLNKKRNVRLLANLSRAPANLDALRESVEADVRVLCI